MRPTARATLFAHLLISVFTTRIVVLALDYGVPVEIKLWDTGRTPLSHMVDVTNEFGLKVLAEHNFLNDNNMAFSPYGLMGILVALYEGVDGESSYQIQKGMQLPWNRNVMRIGFRDIHRTLKTYFVPEEGFLAGLALNNENVTFNEGYKKILRFYGFELDNEQLPTTPATVDNNGTSTVSSAQDAAAAASTAAPSSAAREDLTTTNAADTTTNPNVETISDVDIRMPTSTSTPANSAAPNIETTTLLPTSEVETTESSTTAESTTPFGIDTTRSEVVTETMQYTVLENTSPVIAILNSAETTTALSFSSTVESGMSSNDDETQTQSTSRPLPTSIGVEDSATTQMLELEMTDKVTTSASLTTENGAIEATESAVETLERRKKSIVNFIFTSPSHEHDDVVYRAFDIPIPVPNTKNPNLGGDQMFLANGLKSVQVSYMQYDAVMEHAYLPHLEAAALRLPLDSERYYLLALLPARAHPAELARLLARLARHSDLRDVYAALRPRRVRATLPSFTVKGHVTLTADLQKLGIRDVFEPRQRDFTPMTPQPGVYVRSIEQAVSVAIRKYGADDRNSSRYVSRPPVHFSATYPFLYFVMDASIHVALMAGKMVDPLNSRIL